MMLLGTFCASACIQTGTVQPTTDADSRPALALEVHEPAYGAFAGDGDVVVSGVVTDPEAWVWVEGQRVNVGEAGGFRVTVPIEGQVRVIDVEAAAPEAHLRQRLPVFAGLDPIDTWPGGLALRLTPLGLEHMAEIAAETIAELDTGGQIAAALPTLEVDGLSLVPAGVSHTPITVSLEPIEAGIALAIGTADAEIAYTVDSELTGPLPLALSLDALSLGATLGLETDPGGAVSVAVSDPTVALVGPHLQVAGIEAAALAGVADALAAGVSSALEGALAGLAGPLGAGFDLGGLAGFELDLLGTPIAVAIDAVQTDGDGVGVVFDFDLGDEGGENTVQAPAAAAAHPGSDLALTLHEGMFQLLLQSDLIELLEQDLQLPGIIGDVVGLPITLLPGGHLVPADRTGWCLALDPGAAGVARLQPHTEPFATLLLPDLVLDVGVSTPTLTCLPWLSASLQLEIGLAVTSGTALGVDLTIDDGAVLFYAAEGDWPEAQLVAGLGGLVESVIGLVGGSLELDLADLFGSVGAGTTTTGALPLGDLAPRLLDSEAAIAPDGSPLPGSAVVSVSLWD